MPTKYSVIVISLSSYILITTCTIEAYNILAGSPLPRSPTSGGRLSKWRAPVSSEALNTDDQIDPQGVRRTELRSLRALIGMVGTLGVLQYAAASITVLLSTIICFRQPRVAWTYTVCTIGYISSAIALWHATARQYISSLGW